MISSGRGVTEAQHSFLLLNYGALTGTNMDNGEYWKLVTSQFTHVRFLHMLLNVGFIFVLGKTIEKKFGTISFASIYILSGSVGQFASVTLHPDLVSSGASQALCGLAGFLLVFSKQLLATHRITVIAVAVFMLIQISLDLYFAGYLKAGHTVGFLSGVFLGLGGLFMPIKANLADARKQNG